MGRALAWHRLAPRCMRVVLPVDEAAMQSLTRSVVELIAAKRDGGRLAADEIHQLIAAYSADEVPDYQMAAMLMAIYVRGLDVDETREWTHAMLRSGRVLDLSHLGAGRVDKHSTGGVGDKVSLPLAPAAAACGCLVPMVSGRGLGHTGGTIDKLEAIPGFRADLSIAELEAQLALVGCAIVGQTPDIAPADKKMYALRDVTATVASIPLIVASIMSKKLAEGIEGLVLDVKVGRGAFMPTHAAARDLALAMVAIGEGMGKRVVAFLTRMEEPLGRAVGNANEVRESIDVLNGGGPADIRELVCALGGAMVEIAHGVDEAEGRARIAASLDDGTALGKWEAMVEAQGGDPHGLPAPAGETVIAAPIAGYVEAIDALEVGLTGVQLGAGRTKQGEAVDPQVGIQIRARRGDYVDVGAPLAVIEHGAGGPPRPEARERLANAFTLASAAPAAAPLILERLG